MATYNNIKKIKIGDNIFNLYDSGNSGGTVTSVTVSNATNGGLSISGSPISTSGTISIGHSNVLTSAQTTQAVYPIKIDKNGHISAYGSAVTIVNTRGTAASGGTTLSVVNTGDMYTWNNKQDKLTNPVTGTGTSGYLVKWNGTSTVTNGPQLGSSTTTFLNNKGEWATPANTDEKVTQTPTTTNATYEILFSGTADNETHTEGARKTSTLTYNPSTKTLTTTNIVATYLKATDAKITNVLEANEVHTNKWTAANIANIGGSFYISPTMESNITGATISVSSNVYTFSVSGGTFSTTAANVNWNTGSRVMATGTITKGGVEYPIGTVIGTLSAISSTGFTINNILSANKGTLDKISAASGSYTAGKVQISMYQIKDGSAYKPVGIYLTSYGADTGEGGTRDTSLDTFIDIYGGTNAIGSNAGMGGADPNVRIGYLSHLDSYTDSAGNTRQPTGWGIYTDNGYFKGVVVADSGSIGHFTINENAIYSGEHSAYNTSGKNGIFIGRPSSSSSDYYVSGGPGALWYLKSDGSAKIGAMELTSAGVLSVPAANITNLSTAAVTAVTGSFSMLKSGVITTNANRTTYNAVTAGLTLDMNGIGAGNGTTCTFKVEQDTGILTAIGAILQNIKIYKDTYLKGDFSQDTITLYGGSSTTGTYPKTEISSSGITIAYSNAYKTIINSSGLQVHAGDASNSIASFGSTIRLGYNSSGNIKITSKALSVYSDTNTSQAFIGRYNYEVEGGDEYFFARFGTASSEGNVSIRTNPISGIVEGSSIPRISISDGTNTIATLYKSDSYDLDSDYRYNTSGTLRLGGAAYESRGLTVAGESRVKRTDSSVRQGVGLIDVSGDTASRLTIGVRSKEQIYISDSQLTLTNGSTLNIQSTGIYTNTRFVVPNGYGLRGTTTNYDEANLIYGSTTDNIVVGSTDWADCYVHRVYTSKTGTVSTVPNVAITSTHRLTRTTHANSSIRFKNNIKDVTNPTLDPNHLYDIEIKQFKYNADVITDPNDCRYGKELIGFIAEQVNDCFPIAIDKNDKGECEGWNAQFIIPPMLQLIKNQKEEIEELKERVRALEER